MAGACDRLVARFSPIMRPVWRIADWCRGWRPVVAAITEPPSADVDVSALVRIVEELGRISHPNVVELGTRRQAGQQRNRHEVWVPHAAQYVGVDYQPGEDVDIVADIHELSKHLPPESIDAVIACSTFEHIKYPWIAALEIAKILKVGGFAFLHTHQTFALHAHPHDYWRFSTEGLQTLFPPALGFEILSCHSSIRAAS